MVKTVKITTDNKISVEELPNWSLGSWGKAIGADCTETVKTQIMYDLFREPVVMIVDESGLVKNREVNAVGSFLYGTRTTERRLLETSFSDCRTVRIFCHSQMRSW